MITIDEYIKHTDNLKEMGLLSEDFRIIQYKDGDLLAVDGKCEAFENKPIDNKDYIWCIMVRHSVMKKIIPITVNITWLYSAKMARLS